MVAGKPPAEPAFTLFAYTADMSTDADVSAEPNLRPRDRALRAHGLALSPRERLVEMQRLIDEAWALLEKNPAGKAHFLKRNFKARRIPSTQEPPANGT
jgi:hypothetical protein